jgi:hypothetical protein
MKLSDIRLSEKWFYIFPLLFALYPVIFLYSYNVQELLISQLVMPVTVALCGTVLGWCILLFLVRDTLKAGIAVSILIIFFFTYGLLFDWLAVLDLFPVKNRYLLPVFLVIAGYSAYFVCRINNQEIIRNIAKVLTVILTLLLVINIISLIPYEMKKGELAYENAQQEPGQKNSDVFSTSSSSDYPDIWYIILDEYASPGVISEIWGYDNSEFTDSLRQRGFYIAQNSSTRYHTTFYSLYTSLNMQYPGGKISHSEFYNIIRNWTDSKYSNKTTLDLYNGVNRNAVSAYLKAKGYKRVVMDPSSVEDPAQGKMDADITVEYTPEKQVYLYDDFQMLLLKNSLLRPIEFTQLIQVGVVYDRKDLHRNSNLYQFSQIKNVSRIQGPKFVFVHFTVPHAPFVFDRNGMPVDKSNAFNWMNKKYYLDQYVFTSKKVSEGIDDILKYSDRPPIIILQSDHGVRITQMGQTTEQNLDMPVDDMFRILNAYYFPNNNKQYLYDSITPVNTFRFVFNHTFHDNFTLLEEA